MPLAAVAVTLGVIGALTLTPASPSAVIDETHGILDGPRGLQDFIANVVLFAPLGVALAWTGLRRLWCATFIVLVTMAIEGLQLTLVAGRDASVGDVVANSLGGGLALWIGSRWTTIWNPGPARSRILAAAWAMAGAAVLLGTAWLGGLATPGRVYHGQFTAAGAPSSGSSGLRVIEGRVNGVPVTWGAIGGASQLVTQAAGGRLEMDLWGVVDHAPEPTARVFGLFESAPNWGRQMVVLERWDGDLVFTPQARAERWLLRSPWLLVRDVLRPGDTIWVSARQGSIWRRLTVRAGAREWHAAQPVLLGGWMMVVPQSLTPRWGTNALDVLWLLVLFGPALHWRRRARAGAESPRARR